MRKSIKHSMNVIKKPTIGKDNIRTIALSGYERPIVKEVYGKDWVSFGENNDYFDKLVERYLGSPTNSRCINGIVDMIYGRGLEASDSDMKAEMYAKMKILLKSNDIKRIAHDYKMLGQAAAQVIYNKNKTKILKVVHFPMETLRAEKAKDGKVKAYYYHPKWNDIKTSDNPKRIPTFGNGNNSEVHELYIWKPYRSGLYYYATVDYHGCLQYAQLEEEVSNFHIRNIQNGLQPSLLINFNNGVPNEETQRVIEKKIYDKFGGTSNAGRFILSFNDSAEVKSDIEPIHLPDAHAQYQFLSDESREKIMLGHGIVSPILLGIKDNTGFGNNAEELRTASVIMDNVVIRPFQEGLIEGFNDLLAFNGIFLNLYFITLQPIEFTQLDNISTKIRREEETGEKLSSHIELDDFSDDEGNDLITQLETFGETLSDEWELIHSEEVLDASKDFNFADANPNKASSQDNSIYKVRYAYMPVRNSNGSRHFCKGLESMTSRNIVFRKEDINMMSFKGINKELGHNKQNYSLLKYKGGKNCKHWWEMRVYRKSVGVKSEVSVDSAIKDGLDKPNNPKELDVRPYDMPNKGAYPKIK